jgi:hypothetical protein
MDSGIYAIVLYEKEAALAIRPAEEFALRQPRPEHSGEVTMNIPPPGDFERREDHQRRHRFRGVDELRRQQKTASGDPPAKKLNYIL